MTHAEQGQEILNESGFSDWEVVDDCVLVSPNGHEIEWDGISPDGEESPFLTLGLI